LSAIDGATGVERWTFSVDNAYLISAPTVEHGVAYFGTRSGEIYAVSV
jgi:outer membrane protein assembly factor BamB